MGFHAYWLHTADCPKGENGKSILLGPKPAAGNRRRCVKYPGKATEIKHGTVIPERLTHGTKLVSRYFYDNFLIASFRTLKVESTVQRLMARPKHLPERKVLRMAKSVG